MKCKICGNKIKPRDYRIVIRDNKRVIVLLCSSDCGRNYLTSGGKR